MRPSVVVAVILFSNIKKLFANNTLSGFFYKGLFHSEKSFAFFRFNINSKREKLKNFLSS